MQVQVDVFVLPLTALLFLRRKTLFRVFKT